MPTPEKPPVFPAKLTRPRAARTVARTRLYKRLDQAKNRPVTWLTGPPGAGKTTLVSSYLNARRLKGIWYQVDAGDNDPATFFHYMSIATHHAAPRFRTPLPALTPELRPGLVIFARRYFEALYARLKAPAVLVLDNYQEVAADSAFHAVVAEAAAACPKGVRLLVLSRAEPPAAFARLRANEALSLLNGTELTLTLDEVRAVAKLRDPHKRSATELERLHDSTGGWMAGLVLLLERPDLETPAHTEVSGQQVLFDYFATEIFDKRPQTVQDILLKTSFVPQIGAVMAGQLSGDPAAGHLLAELHRQNYFTHRHGTGAESLYQYHPLFRAFLLARARAAWSHAELLRHLQQAATLLDKNGRADDALVLYLDAEDWTAATRLLLHHAPTLASQGRFGALGAAIARLPPAHYAAQPWVHYWLGVSRLPFDPASALAPLEAAYLGFERTAEVRGVYLAWAGACDAIGFSMRNFKLYDPWLARLDALWASEAKLPDAVSEARLITSALHAINWRQAAHSALPHLLVRARALLHHPLPTPVLARLGSFMMFYMCWHDADDAECRQIADQLDRLSPQLAAFPFERIFKRLMQMNACAMRGVPVQAMALYEANRQDAEQSGVHILDNQCIGVAAWACLGAEDLANGDVLIKRLGGKLGESIHRLDHCLYQHLTAWRSALAGNYSAAVKEMTLAVHLNYELHSVFIYELARHCLAQYQLAGGDAGAARSTLAHPDSQREGNGFVAFAKYVAAGCLAMVDGDAGAARRNVVRAMEISRRGSMVSSTGSLSVLHAKVCAYALEHDIDADTARSMIQRLRLQPPADAPAPDNWPWPVNIRALGQFTVSVQGHPLASTGKQQRKPLDLLKLLVASGERGVPSAQAVEELYPDMEGGSGYKRYAMALHRLRKLIGEASVLTGEGRVRLNPRTCRVDAWAFNTLLTEDLSSAAEQRPERAAQLYGGPFLNGECGETWAVTFRERLHRQYLDTVLARGRALETQRDFEAALVWYRRGLEQDDLMETLYQRIIHCCHQLGQRTEGLAAYERCRVRLRDTLGIAPLPQTDALRNALIATR